MADAWSLYRGAGAGLDVSVTGHTEPVTPLLPGCWSHDGCFHGDSVSSSGPDLVCRWWVSAITMAISWMQGDDAAVRAHFTDVERVPKALEMTEYVTCRACLVGW